MSLDQAFSLPLLMREMSKLHGMNAQDIMASCDRLFNEGLISAPRTDLQFLKESTVSNAYQILENLGIDNSHVDSDGYAHVVPDVLFVNSADFSENSAIHPTGISPNNCRGLTAEDLQIFEAITERFANQFTPAEHAIKLDDKQFRVGLLADRMESLKEWLSPFAREAEKEAEFGCWINGGEDAGVDYCRDDAEKELDRLKAEDPDDEEEYNVGGGYGSDSDSPSCCETCEKQLIVFLTKYAVEAELEHYAIYATNDNPIDMTNSGQAYDLRELLIAAEDYINDEEDIRNNMIVLVGQLEALREVTLQPSVAKP